MTTFLDQLKQQAQAASATAIDMTEVQTGGGDFTPTPEGIAQVRLVGYHEVGEHCATFQGKKKDPVLNFRLIFALVGGVGTLTKHKKGADGKYTDEVDSVENGVPFYTAGDSINTIRTFTIEAKRFEKSKAVKLFNQMNWDKGSPARFWHDYLGRLFKVKVKTSVSKKGGRFPDLDMDYGIQKPISEESGQLYNNTVEIPDDLYSIFLWDAPTIEQWNHIKETRRKDENGVEQPINQYSDEALCLSAVNYQGSKLQQLLEGTNGLPTLVADVSQEAMPEDDEPPFTPDAPSVIPTVDIPAPPAV